MLSPLPNLKMLNGIVNPGWIKRSLGSAFPCCFCTPQQNPFDNSQPFFHYVIGLLLWHSISQLRTAITTMHWETNGHLGGMPLQLYHLVTPGGHKCWMTACNSADSWLDVEKELMFENVRGEGVWLCRINNSCCQHRWDRGNPHKFSLSHHGHLLESCVLSFQLLGPHLFTTEYSRDFGVGWFQALNKISIVGGSYPAAW